jgi:hypothetical protein
MPVKKNKKPLKKDIKDKQKKNKLSQKQQQTVIINVKSSGKKSSSSKKQSPVIIRSQYTPPQNIPFFQEQPKVQPIVKDEEIKYLTKISSSSTPKDLIEVSTQPTQKNLIEVSPPKRVKLYKNPPIDLTPLNNIQQNEVEEIIRPVPTLRLKNPTYEEIKPIRNDYFKLPSFLNENVFSPVSSIEMGIKPIQKDNIKKLKLPIEKINMPSSSKISIIKDENEFIEDDFIDMPTSLPTIFYPSPVVIERSQDYIRDKGDPTIFQSGPKKGQKKTQAEINKAEKKRKSYAESKGKKVK